MPSFDRGPNLRTPFGKNVYLRSTVGLKHESYMCAQSGVPTETIDGVDQRVLQPGTVLAKITSGPDAGMVGVLDSGASDGREDTANIVGLDETFLPWQLDERDVEVAALYDGTAMLAWCFEYVNGVRTPLSVATANAMRNLIHIDVTFH